MKKFLSLLLALILVFSMFTLASCDQNDKDDDDDETVETLDGKTPEELYALSQTKLKEATSYTVTATQVITMSVEDETMTMNQEVISKLDGDNSYVKSTNDMTSDANMEAWYVDGIVYASMMGVKAKAYVDKEEFMQKYMGKDPSESTLLDIPESWFEDIEFEKDGKSWALKFTVKGEEYTKYFANVGLGGTINGNVKHQVFFDSNGNLEKITTVFDMTIQGIDAHCVSTSTVTIGSVTINPPADADSYIQTQLPR
jgi:hypothetical protein